MNTVKDFGVPIALLFIGVLGKLLVKRSWSLGLLFMGPELVLAGLGSDLGHFLDFGSVFLFGGAITNQGELKHAGLGLIYTGGYILGSLGIYMLVLKIHQTFEPATQPSAAGHAGPTGTATPADPGLLAQLVWLVLISNLLGVVSMAAVVFLLRIP